MIASPDFLHDTRQEPSPQPAVTRREQSPRPAAVTEEAARPGPAANADDAAPCASPSPSDPGVAEDGDEELYRLGERIAELAERINSAEARMMTLIADFDRRGGWKGEYSSCAEWLAWRIGIKIGPARERVRTARALAGLPQTAEALRAGRISYAKVRALTRVATPASEAELLNFAQAGSAARLEAMVRMWKKLSREGELTAEEARHRSRTFSVFVDGDGMYVVKGRLEPEVGAVLMRAVEAASEALFRRKGSAGDSRGSGAVRATGDSRAADVSRGADDSRAVGDAGPKPKQRRADAVGLLAERALAAGFGRRECDGSHDSDGGDLGEPGIASGTRAERYQVMVHCDAATLAAEGDPGRSDLDGIRVSSETSRRMACDAAVVAMVHAKDGSVLSVGRRTRTIPPHIRRALEERDRGCRFPGCASRFTEAHHVKHWADGGETSLRNTVLLCRRHHRTVHEGRVKVGRSPDGTVLFFTRGGRILADAPPARQVGADAPQERARADASRSGVQTDARVSSESVPEGLPPIPSADPGGPSRGERVTLSNGAALYRDSAIPWAIEAAAREAVEESMER